MPIPALVEGVRFALGRPRVSVPTLPPALFDLADYHGILPWVFERFQAQISQTEQAKWSQKTDLYRAHYYWRRAHWQGAQTLLKEASIDFLPLKGASTAFELYAKPYRTMGDFDVLISTLDVLRAHHLLEKRGFVAYLPPMPFAWHEELARKRLRRGGIVEAALGRRLYQSQAFDLDVHWDPIYFENTSDPVRFNLENLWQTVNLRQQGLELEPMSQLLFLCVHACHSNRLLPWVDLFLLESKIGPPDLHSSLLIASPAARQKLQSQYKRMRAILWDGASPSQENWILRKQPVTPTSAGPSPFHGYWKKRKDLKKLNLLERFQMLAGFFFPSPNYLKTRPWTQFYGELFRGHLLQLTNSRPTEEK